jgi:cardiolipin synthase
MLFAVDTEHTFLSYYWPHIVAVLTVCVQLAAAGHCVLHKRDVRAAIGWVGLIWLAPLLGAGMYALFGINRIRRKARSLRSDTGKRKRKLPNACSPEELSKRLGDDGEHLGELAHMSGVVTGLPLLAGNRVTPLVHACRAYPAMLEAIDNAEKTIVLSSYIFNDDSAGEQFVRALGEAVERGVEVRVLVDAVGSRYGHPPVTRHLKKAKVPCARFLPAVVPVFMPYYNLRNHRKILVIDGKVGFTGGMNIRESGREEDCTRHALHDLHFKLEGPVVAHLFSTFADDWEFTTHEVLEGELWQPKPAACGEVVARGIVDGPDENNGKLRLAILGALACAHRSVRIVTPYFLPDSSLITALNVARLRGIEVDILLPAMNNLAMVQWASTAMLWQVLEYGCRVWLTPPPFDHTKLMLVDGCWTLLGSGNWDARSLRLNFEFNVECYDAALHDELNATIEAKLKQSHQVTLAEVDARKLPIRLRDGVARLLSPYL